MSEVRVFAVDRTIAGKVRAILATRVRLKVVEMPPFLSIFGKTRFTVTGPAFALDAAAEEIQDVEHHGWLDRQW